MEGFMSDPVQGVYRFFKAGDIDCGMQQKTVEDGQGGVHF